MEEGGRIGQAAQQIGRKNAIELADGRKVAGVALDELCFGGVLDAVGGQGHSDAGADVALDGQWHSCALFSFHFVTGVHESVAAKGHTSEQYKQNNTYKKCACRQRQKCNHLKSRPITSSKTFAISNE
jgi:hypothetical protein